MNATKHTHIEAE